jgi:hypothetical protein
VVEAASVTFAVGHPAGFRELDKEAGPQLSIMQT